MGFLLGILKVVLKVVCKIAYFCGLCWFLIPMGVGMIAELITGKALWGGELNVISFICDILWYVCYVLAPMTFIQNIIRTVMKNDFSWIKLIRGKTSKIGNVAEFNKSDIALKNKDELSGVVYGKHNGKYVTQPETTDGHAVVIGGAGSGKTRGIAMPTLISWKHRAFVIDVKGELYEETSNARGKERIKVFNPFDENAYNYDPYYVFGCADEISEVALQLATAIIPMPEDVKEPFFITSAQNMLCGFLIYFYELGEDFSSTMRAIKSVPIKEIIQQIANDNNEKAKMQIMQFVDMDAKTLSNIFSELSNHITAFATSDKLQRALSRNGNCITPNDLENGYDIFCCVPEEMITEWKDLMSMMCNQFFKFFEKRKNNNSEPILFLVDEFPRIGKIQNINSALATLRSKGIHILLVIQSLSQLSSIYGDKIAEVISDNCSYKAILRASEPKTQKWCSDLVGTYDKKKLSKNFNSDMLGVGKGQGTSLSTEEKRIINPADFAYLQDVVCLFPNGYRRIEKIKYGDELVG